MSGFTSKARGRTFLAGKVIFNFGQSTIDCVVRKLTENGATIEFATGLGVPDRFQLSLVSEGMLLPCKVVWQSEQQIGVSFQNLKLKISQLKKSDAVSAAQIIRFAIKCLRCAQRSTTCRLASCYTRS